MGIYVDAEGNQVDLEDYLNPNGKPKNRERLGLTNPSLRRRQLWEQGQINANNRVKGSGIRSIRPERTGEMPLDAADKVEYQREGKG